MRIRNIITKILVFGSICFILFFHIANLYFFDSNNYADILDLKTLISEGIFPTSDELKECELDGINYYTYHSSSTDGIITVHAYGIKFEHVIMKFTHDLEEISYNFCKVHFTILSIGFTILCGIIVTIFIEFTMFMVNKLKKKKEKA